MLLIFLVFFLDDDEIDDDVGVFIDDDETITPRSPDFSISNLTDLISNISDGLNL